MTPLGILDPLPVRLGLGLLRLTTAGRPDTIDALAVLHAALHRGVRLFDTADVYCLGENDLHDGERLLSEAVSSWKGPRRELRLVTKAGMTRPGGQWRPDGRPEHLRRAVAGSLQALRVNRLFLLLLHRRDSDVPFDETLAALAELQREGLVEHLGLCNVTADEIEQARRHFPVAAVQNECSLLEPSRFDRGAFETARRLAIPFLAYRPLGGIAKRPAWGRNERLAELAAARGVTPAEMALAALAAMGEHVVPIVGATRIESVASSIRAAGIVLTADERERLAAAFPWLGAAAPGGNGAGPSVDGLRAVRPAPAAQQVGPRAAPEVVLISGIQGAGKSVLTQPYVQAGYLRFNRDELGGTLEGLVPRLAQALDAGQRRIVLDNTYPTRAARAAVIAAARSRGLPVRCLHLDTPLHEAWINIVLRMLSRYGVPLGPAELKQFSKVDANLPPPQALARYLSLLEPPDVAEGFYDVVRVPFVRAEPPDHDRKGLLLDVDGTLRTTRSGEVYPRHPDDVVLLPGRRERLAEWVARGFQLFFVSNQAGVASGKVAHHAVQAAMFRTAELLGLPVREIAYCPHPSRPVGCYCRKPMPGLGVYLMQRHRLARASTAMVGDKDSDAEFARHLGVRYVDAHDFFERGVDPWAAAPAQAP